MKKNWFQMLLEGMFALFSAAFGLAGCYPLLPAYYAVCAVRGRDRFWVTLSCLWSLFLFVPVTHMVRYVFALAIIGIAIRLVRRMNRGCPVWLGALIAAGTSFLLHLAEQGLGYRTEAFLLRAGSEACVVFSACIGIFWLGRLPLKILQLRKVGECRSSSRKREAYLLPQTAAGRETERMESLANAVSGLSDAFFSMSTGKERLPAEEVGIMEQEVTGKLCAGCDACALCWNEGRMRRQGGIRALLYAVLNHGTREELLEEPYVEGCHRYETMVEEALNAFTRLELNTAWCNRLKENRYVIARQLDAMAGLMETWAKSRTFLDHEYGLCLSAIEAEAREKGLLCQQLHIFEENGRLCLEGYVRSKWDGGIPAKQFLAAAEKGLLRRLRFGKDVKLIFGKEAGFVTLYEDTKFYVLQGIMAEKKNASPVNGDNLSFFALDDGSYHICLSDGMGSGFRAKQESEMVVDLMQKFMEAGFAKETAIRLMNSAMVLQGEDGIYSTLDYAQIDMYTGEVELIKIGAAATYLKHKDLVECLDQGSLPAGADVAMEPESTKRQLQNGDFLVMVTDGVLEYLHVRNPKETLGDIIGAIQTENAGTFAELLMEQVMQRTGGYAMDDMTIIVTGIWEK